jgi:hypothetical protein
MKPDWKCALKGCTLRVFHMHGASAFTAAGQTSAGANAVDDETLDKMIADWCALGPFEPLRAVGEILKLQRARITELETALEEAQQKCTNNPSGRNSCVSRSGDDADWCDGCKKWSAARATKERKR